MVGDAIPPTISATHPGPTSELKYEGRGLLYLMQDEVQLLGRIADTVEELVARTPQDRFGDPGGMGASGSPAKHIDRLAEDAVVQQLETSELSFNLCSEEMGTEDRGAERTLVVDPIDGTTNAVRGIPFYSISLAIATTGLEDVELGLVRNLPTGDTYLARRGQGATLNGRPIETRAFSPDAGVVSPIEVPDVLPALPKSVRTPRHPRGLGACSLELCLVGQGAMDVYLHTRTGLRIIDIAAGMLIAEEAGGSVITPDGSRPEMGFDVRQRTDLIAVGDKAVLPKLGVPA